MYCCPASCCDRPIERTFDIVDVGGRRHLVFADGMVPADLVTRVQRGDDGRIGVEYNAGGKPFGAAFRPVPRRD